MAEKAQGLTLEQEEAIEDLKMWLRHPNGIYLGATLGYTEFDIHNLVRLGYKLYEEGKIDQARIAYEGVHVLDPTNLDAMLGLGSIYTMQGHLGQAMELFTRVLSVAPENRFALLQRGECAIRQQAFGAALRDFKAVLAQDPQAEGPEARRALTIISNAKQMAETQTQEVPKSFEEEGPSARAALPPMTPVTPPAHNLRIPPGGVALHFGGSANAAGFLKGLGDGFFETYNAKLEEINQMGGMLGAGMGQFGGAQMPMPQPLNPRDIESKLKACGYGDAKHVLEVGSYTLTNGGFGRIKIRGRDGRMLIINAFAHNPTEPPRIELQIMGLRHKALMDMPTDSLQEGRELQLPNGAKLRLQSNEEHITGLEITTKDGQVAKVAGFLPGALSWESEAQALHISGPQQQSSRAIDAITKGGVNPTPGQIAQGNAQHLEPFAAFLQPHVQGLASQQDELSLQASIQLHMLLNMIHLMSQLAQMFKMTRGSFFTHIPR